MTMRAFIFPGQGAQFFGMGQALADAFPSARAVFDEVDEALGEKLSEIIWNGPEEALTLTANAQPALMAVSMAAVRALEAEFGITLDIAAYAAGHSLGEYSALCAAGSITLSDTARLLRVRGKAMQAAVAPGLGAMAALLGAETDQAEAACAAGLAAAGGTCEIANDNAPGQLVLSGTSTAIEAACVHAREIGVKKAVPLAVSAPFHCSLMAPAAEVMREALANAHISPPRIPLIANVTARPTSDPEAIRLHLVDQVTGRVRWRESVEFMAAEGVLETVEAGAGKVLTVMNRRTARDLSGLTLGTPEDLEAFAKALQS